MGICSATGGGPDHGRFLSHNVTVTPQPELSVQYPVALQRFNRIERKRAQRRYQQWTEVSKKRSPVGWKDLQPQVLSMTYIGVAQLWLAIATPVTLAAACLWGSHANSAVLVSATLVSLIDIILFGFMGVRLNQSREYCQGPVRPKEWK
jgi:hypothetical protein